MNIRIQELASKHFKVININPETGRMIKDKEKHDTDEDEIELSNGRGLSFETYVNNSLLNVGEYLLSKCLRDGCTPGGLINTVSKLSTFGYGDKLYIVDVFSYYGLDIDKLSLVTPLEFIKSLSQVNVDAIVDKTDKVGPAFGAGLTRRRQYR